MRDDLFHDWNADGAPARPPWSPELDDETLRDGLQSASAHNPPVERKIEILHLVAGLGIGAADIGMPGAGALAYEHALRLAREIGGSRLPIVPNCAARAVKADIGPVADVQQAAGVRVEAAIFMGSSRIRQVVEDWDLGYLLRTTEEAVTFARGLGLEVMFVTEDTTRTPPDVIHALYRCAIEHGARRVVIADTAGQATPAGVRAIVGFLRRLIEESGEDVKLDWHGHQDRGLAVINAITAFEAGVHRLHGTAFGIGERCGNCPLDTLLVNLKLLGYVGNDLRRLGEYVRTVSAAVGIPVPANWPAVGADAFRTATGVHAATVRKALLSGDTWLANRVYSSVPADEVGGRQVIRVGPMSGRSNILFWLEAHSIQPTDALVEAIFRAAKRSDRILTDEDLLALTRDARP
ncbi:MAG: LeuA family protein [Planctomycetes bacterium]|jgi:2-isopropylmalate synthase|nr:LeuA family protein [Planctomycetota bacterium]